MSRRFLILTGFITFFLVSQGIAQTNNLEDDVALTADILIAQLYAKTNAEKDYCEKIIQLRDTGILPNRILYGVYRKAVSREKDRRFSYFQTALEILCKREGIDLSQSVPVKSTIFYGLTPSKPTISTPSKPQTTTTSKPFAFFSNLFRR